MRNDSTYVEFVLVSMLSDPRHVLAHNDTIAVCGHSMPEAVKELDYRIRTPANDSVGKTSPLCASDLPGQREIEPARCRYFYDYFSEIYRCSECCRESILPPESWKYTLSLWRLGSGSTSTVFGSCLSTYIHLRRVCTCAELCDAFISCIHVLLHS